MSAWRTSSTRPLSEHSGNGNMLPKVDSRRVLEAQAKKKDAVRIVVTGAVGVEGLRAGKRHGFDRFRLSCLGESRDPRRTAFGRNSGA